MDWTEQFLIRFGIHVISILVLIRFCYFGAHRQRSHASAFILFGLGVFMVTALLHQTELSMGFAFGLFAVFSMLRYRTESISVKEMTYLFLVIALSLMNAVAVIDWTFLVAINGVLIVVAAALESNFVMEKVLEREIDYDKIDNIKAENRQRLINDIEARTGWKIKKVDLLHVDFVKDCARIRVQYQSTMDGVEQYTEETKRISI